MPVKRRIPKQRLGSNELTRGQLQYLIDGEALFHRGVIFESEEDIRECWENHREQVLTQRSKEPTGFRPSYRPGTRPWAWWRFEQDLEQAPDFEFRELDRLGLIDDTERREAAALALEAWERTTRSYIPKWKALADSITVGQLLDYWPSQPEINLKGLLSWSTNDPRPRLVDHRRGDTTA